MKSLKLRLVVFSGLVIFFLGLGSLWWVNATAPANIFDKTPRIFVVNRGDGVRDIASRLKKEGLIKDQIAFFLLIKKMGIDQNLQAGDFRLNPSMNAQTVALTLTKGMLDVWVTFLEGWRNEEMALKLAQELSLPESEFLRYAQEGYMFPDTYLLPKDASGSAIAKILRDNFDQKFTLELSDRAKKKGLTQAEVITLASIVEKEASGDADRDTIAAILLKRLERGWPLQADATVQYAVGFQAQERSWWKKELTTADKAVKSQYNTYLFPGLPPGPIANPGLASIKAVLNSGETPYWYYLHDPEGNVHFAKTIEEHEANIQKYLE